MRELTQKYICVDTYLLIAGVWSSSSKELIVEETEVSKKYVNNYV